MDGFLIDRGFQVLLDSYPGARRVLDLVALDLPSSAGGTTTALSLGERGFSGRAIESCFRPFFGGVFLDPRLNAPLRWFEFLLALFARSRAVEWSSPSGR